MSNNIKYNLTPWDEKSFNFKTAEFFFDIYNDINITEFNNIEKELFELNVKFIYTRISSENIKLRHELQNLGFYFAETSIELNLNSLQNFEKKKLPKISYRLAEKEDINTIKEIARDSFNFGRFHEDENISIIKSRLRYYNWIDDLVNQGSEIYIAKVGVNIIGFNIQKTDYDKKQTKLVLAGCKKGAEIFSYSLWNEILETNKISGINNIIALISASNIGVFNIYLKFNFVIRKTYMGFHKMLIN